MPIQAPQWTDYLNCPACCREFAPLRSPVSLGCGHTLCRPCLKNLHRKQCPFDQTVISVDLEDLVVNTALLQLAGYTPPTQPYHPPSIQVLSEQDRHAYDVVVKCLEQLAVFLKYCGNANNVMGSRLSRPMQRKLVTLLQCAMTDEEGRGKAARAARSLGDRTVTELIVQHQNPQQLSANLWAAVRSRGCQFLGPAMQEEVLKLVLLALEDGSALSRKVLVMFVVQRLEPHFPQASKTSIGHVVQLLYRASCFKVSKRVCDSSLMQLKEEFRTYDSLRREHDAQIVQIATEAGLRIAPDQWSALLYGDTQHKSHMQSIIDKLQTPQSFAQSVQELFITLQRTGDPAQLIAMSIPLDRLANIDASPDAKSPTWQQLSAIMTSLKDIVSRLVHFLQQQSTIRDVNHNAKTTDRMAETQTQQTTIAGVVPGRYKVAMCRDAQNRTYCPRGNNCTYAHSEEELERYRRINNAVHTGNYQYVMQTAIALPRPAYQRFSVPPPQISNMDQNYSMPPMQQQVSPSSRRSMVGVDAMDREQTYDHERDQMYEHQREQSYDHAREQSYDHARDQSYDHARDHARKHSYDHAREQPYEHAREQPYEHIREKSYDHAREPSYEHPRELSYDHREQSYDHPPPNVAGDNYVGSYANALMHGTDNMARVGPNQNSQHQNANVNMMPPSGRYYSRYVERSAYPYLQHMDGGRINEDRSQYSGMSVSIGSVDHNHVEYPSVEYPQQPYIDESEVEDVASALEQLSSPSAGPWQEVSALWRETVRARLRYLYYEEGTLQEYFNKYPILKSSDGWRLLTYDYEALFPDKSRGLDALNASSENILKAAQQKLNTTKDKFLRRKIADTLAICDDGAEMHFDSLSYGITVPHPITIVQPMPIPQPQEQAWPTNNTMKPPPMFKFEEMAKNLPIGMEIGKSIPIGMDMLKNKPIGIDMGQNAPIGLEIGQNMPIGMELGQNMPIGMEMVQNMPIGMEMVQNMPIGIEMGQNMSIGVEIAKNMPIGMPPTNGDMMHHGMDVRIQPKVMGRSETQKRDDMVADRRQSAKKADSVSEQELEKELKALEQRISSEFSHIVEPAASKVNIIPKE